MEDLIVLMDKLQVAIDCTNKAHKRLAMTEAEFNRLSRISKLKKEQVPEYALLALYEARGDVSEAMTHQRAMMKELERLRPEPEDYANFA